jgi:hypothetical protein
MRGPTQARRPRTVFPELASSAEMALGRSQKARRFDLKTTRVDARVLLERVTERAGAIQCSLAV